MEEFTLGSRTLQPHRQLLADGQRIPLGKRALDILSALAEARGAIVTKDELLEAVWPGIVVEENALQVHIAALRKALGPEASRIETIRGVGYRLLIEPQERESKPPPSYGERHPESPATETPRPGGHAARTGWRKWTLVGAALAVLLLAGWWVGGAERLRLVPQDRIPIVVQQLQPSESSHVTEAALAGGITDELIVRLRRVPELRIASTVGEGEIPGGAFSKASRLNGTVRLNGEELRVTARLTNGAGEIIWAQTFDRPFAELFGLQEEIAAAIASALSVSFDVGTDSTAYGGTNNPEAYASYLGYRAHQFDPDPSAALRYLDRALALDPNYGKALVARSNLFGFQTARASSRAQASAILAQWDRQTARVIADRPKMAMGHSARSGYLAVRHDVAGAERSARRAEQLNEGLDPELTGYAAQWAITMGRPSRALSLLQSRELIDPIYRDDPRYVLAFLQRGRLEDSIAFFDRLAADPAKRLGRVADYPFWAHLLAGREDAAARFAARYNVVANAALELLRRNSRLAGMSPKELRAWADERYGDAGHVDLTNTALAAGYLGQPRLAMALMRLAFERPGGYALHLLWTPMMAEARKTDDFEKLVTELGFVAAWRESGDWGEFCRPQQGGGINCT